MGHSSKKKKRGGGSGRRNKGRTPLNDHESFATDVNELLSEEITALCAIFQEDCKVVSGSPPQIIIKLRPYSKDMGYEDLDVSAFLSVRCLPGYPYKCPKLQITPERGLSDIEADNLVSLLQDQANSNAREGRVMIFNLVEAAQEFLSEIVPGDHSHDSVSCSSLDSSGQLFLNTSIASNKICSSRGPFVYGFIDLFSGSGESWRWGIGMDESSGINPSVQSHKLDSSKLGYEVPGEKLDKKAKLLAVQDIKQGSLLISPASRLDTLEEESEDDTKTISTSDSNLSLLEEMVGNDSVCEKKASNSLYHLQK